MERPVARLAMSGFLAQSMQAINMVSKAGSKLDFSMVVLVYCP